MSEEFFMNFPARIEGLIFIANQWDDLRGYAGNIPRIKEKFTLAS